jgi:hypothetical protein
VSKNIIRITLTRLVKKWGVTISVPRYVNIHFCKAHLKHEHAKEVLLEHETNAFIRRRNGCA